MERQQNRNSPTPGQRGPGGIIYPTPKEDTPYRMTLEPPDPTYCINCIHRRYGSESENDQSKWKCDTGEVQVNPLSGIRVLETFCREKNKEAQCVDYLSAKEDDNENLPNITTQIIVLVVVLTFVGVLFGGFAYT